MIFDQITGALYSDKGEFIKTVYCPFALRSNQLSRISATTEDRLCIHCKKTVHSIDGMSDFEAMEMITQDDSACIFATTNAKNITFLQPIGVSTKNTDDLPVIRSLRSLEAMQSSLAKGETLLFSDTGERSNFGAEKYIVYQHKKTQKLLWSTDYRSSAPLDKNGEPNLTEWTLIRDWFFVRPDRPFPFGAYVIPNGVEPGTRVFVEDVIEDSLQETGSQGSSERRVSCTATWNGETLELDPPEDLMIFG